MELVLLVVSLSFLAPAVFGLLLLVLFWVSRPTAILVQIPIFAGFFGLVLMPVLKWVEPISEFWLLSCAALAGMVFVSAYVRFPAVKLFLSVLAPSVFIFPAVFLASSPITRVVPGNSSPRLELAKVGPVEDAVPVVMVIFDELPLFSLLDTEGNIDKGRFPNFAALADESTWYRYATTVAESTDTAVPAILSGRYPKQGKLGTYLDYPDNLFTLLAGTHGLKVFESFTQMCPPELCSQEFRETFRTRLRLLFDDLAIIYGHLVLPLQWTNRLSDIRQGWGQFRWQAWGGVFYRQVVGSFERFLDSLELTATPQLYYYHGVLPHAPWVFLPSGKRYSRSSSELFLRQGQWIENEVLVSYGFQRYLLQLGFTDRLLGRLVARLKRIGLYDEALILVLSDHGFSHRPGGNRRGADHGNYSQIMSVPLFVRFPGQTQSVVSHTNVELVDLLPTIAEVTGLPLSWSVDGISLVANPAWRSATKLFFKRGVSAPLVVDSRLETPLNRVVCSEGRVYPDRPGRLIGVLESVETSETEVLFKGGAGDLQLGEPVDGIFVFLDNQLIHLAPLNERRPDIATFYSNVKLINTGFRFRLERRLLEQNPTSVVRLFAWKDESVSEVIYKADYPWKPDPQFEDRRLDVQFCTPGVSRLILEKATDQSSEDRPEEILKRRASGAGPDLILPPTAFSELLGMQEEELEAKKAEFWVEVERPELYDSIDPQDTFVPAEVLGRVYSSKPLPEGAQLLVTLNGVTSSVVSFFGEGTGERRFVSVLPERNFVKGVNRLSFYLVWREEGQHRVFSPTRSARLEQ